MLDHHPGQSSAVLAGKALHQTCALMQADGKRADEIPLAARIVRIADIYDALRSRRPYKPSLDHAEARNIILHGDDRIDAAGHFDPRVVEAFGDTHESFDQIWCDLQNA